jgi:hypothetical protein
MTNESPLEGAQLSVNPFWDLVRTLPDGGMGFDDRWRPTAYGMVATADGGYDRDASLPNRRDLTRQFAWAIPSPDTLAWIVKQLDGRPVVEVGAGTGYWAWQLHQLGVDVVAFDSHPPDQVPNWFHSQHAKVWHVFTQADQDKMNERYGPLMEAWEYWKKRPEGERNGWEVFFPVAMADALAVPSFPDRVLFLCWPPYSNEMATDALNTYAGDTLVFIGEGEGGCTGDDSFFKVLEERWAEVAMFAEHVQWDGLHDNVWVYSRKPGAVEG